MANPQNIINLALVLDDRLSRERAGILKRTIQSLKHVGRVTILPGDITEEQLLAKLEGGGFHLVLAPWYRYFAWSRVEAHYGLTRSSGPTFAGYFCEAMTHAELGRHADHLRTILLDFAQLNPAESVRLVRSLAHDQLRTGLRPLLDDRSPLYSETWYGVQGSGGFGPGSRLDAIQKLIENHPDWSKRANAIRIATCAMWSLVYDEGPGKSHLAQSLAWKAPRAYFQAGFDDLCFTLRLCYSMPNWSPKDTLAAFWPDSAKPSAASQLLLTYADAVRIHTIADAGDLEVTIVFFGSAPAEKAPTQVRTFWVEPILPSLVSEIPFQTPSPAQPWLRAMPQASVPRQVPTEAQAAAAASAAADRAPAALQPTAKEEIERERELALARAKIEEITGRLNDREELLLELRRGGVGTAPVIAPPDAEQLIEAFQERFLEAAFEIREFEKKLVDIDLRGGNPLETARLKQQMQALVTRQQNWIRMLAEVFERARGGAGAKGAAGGR